MKKATDKSVRENTTIAKMVNGLIVVENKKHGIIFSFPAAVWPVLPPQQRAWVERLTPWWDMSQPDWSPLSHRLRESCVAAINILTRPVPKTANPLTDRGMSVTPSTFILQPSTFNLQPSTFC